MSQPQSPADDLPLSDRLRYECARLQRIVIRPADVQTEVAIIVPLLQEAATALDLVRAHTAREARLNKPPTMPDAETLQLGAMILAQQLHQQEEAQVGKLVHVLERYLEGPAVDILMRAHGYTLRDSFAIAALSAFPPDLKVSLDQATSHCWKMADAMMKTRGL